MAIRPFINQREAGAYRMQQSDTLDGHSFFGGRGTYKGFERPTESTGSGDQASGDQPQQNDGVGTDAGAASPQLPDHSDTTVPVTDQPQQDQAPALDAGAEVPQLPAPSDAAPVDTQPLTPVDAGDRPDNAIVLHPGDNIQEALHAGGAGAVFWLEAGVYRMQQIEPLEGQTILGATGAVLNGSKLLTEFTPSDGHWVAEGQTQEGLRHETDESAEGAQRAGYPDAVYINDQPLTPVDSIDQLRSGTYFFDYDADRIFLADNPEGQTVEAAVSPFAIASSANGVTVSGLTVEKYATPTQEAAISGNGEGWVISHNEVRLNYGVGINVGENGQILDNYVHDNGQMGLNAGGNGILVEGNEIASNGFWSGIDVLWEGGGAKFTETDGLMVRNNYSHDNNGYGLWTDIDNINTVYAGNRIEFNSQGGINHEISYAASIHDNSFVGNGGNGLTWLWGSAIQVQNSQNVEIFNNTVDASSGGNGIGLIQQDRGTGAFGDYVTINNSVHDNTVILSSDGGVGAVADYDEERMLAGGNVFANNEYHVQASGEDQFAYGDYHTFESFVNAGQDLGSSVVIG